MFEENQPQNPNRPNPPTIQPEQKQEIARAPQKEGPMDIHTMPNKFMKEEKGGSSKKKLLIVLIIVVVFAGVAAAAVFLFDRLSTPENTNSVVVNTNANENTNANDNVNTNVNANSNENSNVNVNISTNMNDNTNLNTNTNANTNTSTILIPPLSTSDDDNDGLTNIEESLWGTGINQPDTDGDGFIDGKETLATGSITGELYLGYDPTASGTKLESTSLVKRYSNTTYNWSMLYPAKWGANQVSSATGEANIMFSPDTGTLEYMQVSVQENTTRLSAKNWYLSLDPSVEISQIEEQT